MPKITKLLIIMANVARKIKTGKGLRLKIVNPDAAGIDVADGEMQVCVPEDRDGENNRRFNSFTCDLHEICAWLKACRITTVAMEATGVYWLNIFLMLEDEGFDVVLANPLQVKNLTDKKTDEADAEWLMLMHSYGMVKPSFQPDNVARQIRNMTRHRSNLIATAVAIMCAVFVYFVMVFLTKAITKEEIALVPKGELIWKIATKMHLAK